MVDFLVYGTLVAVSHVAFDSKEGMVSEDWCFKQTERFRSGYGIIDEALDTHNAIIMSIMDSNSWSLSAPACAYAVNQAFTDFFYKLLYFKYTAKNP